MKFKKISRKIALIIAVTVVTVAGTTSGIFQARLSLRLNQYSQEILRNEITAKTGDYNLPFTDAIYIVKSVRNFVESYFDTNAYRSDPEGYFENEVRPVMSGFIFNIVKSSDFINGAYFSLNPKLSGNQFIGEIFFERDEDGNIIEEEPYPYEEYLDENSEDMEWFFGAFNSGRPYWTNPYEDFVSGEIVISFSEPIVVNGETIGIAGIDIDINDIKDMISNYVIYSSGFALLKHQYDFFETNNFIIGLSALERESLIAAADSVNNGDIFEISLNGASYMGIRDSLINDFSVFILVPKNEYNSENIESLIRFAILFPSIFVIVLFLSFFVGKSISKPIVIVSEHLETIASGDYSAPLSQKILEIPDEIGTLARVSHNLRLRLAYLTARVKTISECNLTETVELAFNGDVAGIALNDTLKTLNEMFLNLNIIAEELQSESANLADGSNTLSEGCLEQSKAVNELIDIMDNIVNSNKDNVVMLEEALKIESMVKNDARAGDDNMKKLSETVREINEASKGIHKILKAIEDIAFQTNILALNAAVEAARAGQHGKGFAVVAEEVRNLAAKSAEAAKETAHLVGVSTRKAEAGENLAVITAESLSKIISGINKTEEIIKKIEMNSHKNDSDISLMNKDLNIVSDITQRTASTAEETAAMSDEMNGQANSLRNIVSVFKIKKK
ncbi:MAG: methyl-accepting chemotaxis protein [Oscillospiraceae bacterium]|jgi:methyl-accepting chemotaxis protein|nr:methyl-accepting chemotaxis protein [Oscillospiraceae bacterium]